jgi:hypothetical protein
MKLNEIYLSDSHNIELTVALPIYNSKKIAWLALESLSNQINITFDWELIVYEENHENSIFSDIIDEYIDRFKKLNCKRVLFITRDDKVNLISKWMTMGLESSPSSKVYMLHAADCYSPKERLKITYEKIVKENYDWYDQRKGYFYSFLSDKIFLYNYEGLTNLNMGLNIEYIKTLPYSDINKGIDGYIFNHIKKSKKIKVKKYTDQNLYSDSIDTHGLNNISLSRETYFSTKPNIFKSVDFGVDSFKLPSYIINRLKDLRVDVKPVHTDSVVDVKPVHTENILQPKVRIRKRKNEVVNPTPSSLTQFNLTKSNINKLTTQNNNKVPQSVGKISR